MAQLPSDISGLRLWLDAQDTASLVRPGNFITEWGNRANPDNPAIQPTGINQPSLSAEGINKRTSIYFDGLDDYMTLTSDIRTTPGEYHFFIVARGEAGGDTWARIASSWSCTGDPWAAPNWILWAPNNGGAVEAFDAGIKISNGGNQGLQALTLGADAGNPAINNFKGYVGEVLLYDRLLSSGEFTQVLAYLNERWGFETETYEPPKSVNLEPRLRDLGDAFGLKIGSITRDNFYNFPETELYQNILGQNFAIMTTGNAAKYGPLSSAQGSYDFSTLNKHLAVAEAYNMDFHGHVFVWHSQTPNWLESGSWTRQELIDILNDHIDQVGGYLRGRVSVWDVVNEPFATDGTWRSPSIWNDTIDAANANTAQRDFIDLAFQRARQVDPDATLILNDFAVSEINAKSDAMYAWAQSMLNRGIPLDGVGFQMHLDGPINYDDFANNMQRFADLGLEIHITELDVRVEIPFTTSKSIAQADVYRQVIRRVLEQPAAKTFTMWGFTDAHSWIPDFYPGTDNGLIFDKDYNPKHAFVALQEELTNRLSVDGMLSRFFGKGAGSSEASPDNDYDFDGLSNLFEVAMNLDPTTPSQIEAPIHVTPESVSVVFTPRFITTDLEIRVENSIDLMNWQPIAKRVAGSTGWIVQKNGINLQLNSTSGQVTITDSNIGIPHFSRIVIEQITSE